MRMFGRRLRSSRVAAGFGDLGEFAKLVGITRKRYRKFEDGKKMPEVGELVLISQLVGKSTDYLLTGEERKSGVACRPATCPVMAVA